MDLLVTGLQLSQSQHGQLLPLRERTMLFKQLLKPFLPKKLLTLRNRVLTTRLNAQFATQPAPKIFEAVYKRQLWGSGENGDYFSGPGSHDAQLVDAYVDAVTNLIANLPAPPNVVDLGCGDFNIGKRIRPYCGNYIACDIVPGLIERNNKLFGNLNVDFRALDISRDTIPDGDIVFIRQVLQHMCNRQIAALLPKLAKFKWAIVTEHLPTENEFQPNIDKPAGPTIRLSSGSGVVLEKPPFELQHHMRRELCAIPYSPGIVISLAYRLQP